MISPLRKHFNEQTFSPEGYERFKEIMESTYGYKPDFRLAETPIFLPNILRDRVLQACDDIVEVLCQPNFKEQTQAPLVENEVEVPNEDDHTTFLQMDFAVCIDEKGDPTPQLIEVQGFPTLYFFQEMLAGAFRKAYKMPEEFTSRFNGLTVQDYFDKLREIIVGDVKPEQVIMLEIEPEKQHTYIDFLATEAELGIKTLCLSNLKKDGKTLYYFNQSGEKVIVKRIYNRVIFDELDQRKDLVREFNFADDVDVEWIGHPNWFYRISKFILPMIKSPYSPESFYLDKLESYPEDLENFVLKPLYSFAGAGVKLHITPEELDAIPNKDNYIIQRKVVYAPVLETPTGTAKCEIRILMLWEKGAEKPVAFNNMIRITKGEMVGVKYNKDKDWVGASIGFFE
ncbi:MAG: hypothetical protein ACI8YQ_003660 [Polaribacter sp.]|jgi:hypothetical protein